MAPSNLTPDANPSLWHKKRTWGGIAMVLVLGTTLALKPYWPKLVKLTQFTVGPWSGVEAIPPLAMKGGDPYLRALMRTISASESHTPRPYHVIYGGHHVGDLSKHPNRCIPIPLGPNRGNCSTASGRYQFLNTTWAEKAHKYHPKPQKILLWETYSFEPIYQDQVLYRWLADSNAWGMDLSQQLRAGKINTVLRRLSPTWTSLGYGIETNWMSHRLPSLYGQLLQEEIQGQALKP